MPDEHGLIGVWDMTILIAGILLWFATHLFKRAAPNLRDRLIDRFGLGSIKLSVTALSFISLTLIVVGFKTTPFIAIYDPPSWGKYVNNPMMFGAVLLFGLGSSRGRMRTWFRHPMLTGVIVWALAHLLVNGDNASLVLFPAMLVWALAEIVAINAASAPWVRPDAGPAIYDLRLIGISVAVFAVITFIHGLVGPSPFPG
jgi:uncharacterized membrane protein